MFVTPFCAIIFSMQRKNPLLAACAVLALGESAGHLSATCADAWPAIALVATLVLLFGYGLSLPGWKPLVLALLGLTLFYRTATAREQLYREKPWLRLARRQHQVQAAGDVRQGRLPVLRHELSERLELGLEHNRSLAGLNRAILLGEREHLSRRTKRLFVSAGTIHVFAVSGLHVMIVAWTLVYLLLFLRVPFRVAGLVALPILWGYVAVIGAPPSSVRAALMASFYFSAPLFWRRPDALVAWELTFLTVHVVHPENIANVGSLLSFTVMFAILLTARAARNLSSRWQGALVSLAAWGAGVPIAAHVFGRITPGGLLANLALIPAATVTVVSGVLGLLASFVSDSLAGHLNNLSALFTEAMVAVSGFVAALPGANFVTRPWTYAECAAWYATMLLLPPAAVRLFRRRPF